MRQGPGTSARSGVPAGRATTRTLAPSAGWESTAITPSQLKIGPRPDGLSGERSARGMEKGVSTSAQAAPQSAAGRLGFAAGQVIQEFGYDSDVDDGLR